MPLTKHHIVCFLSHFWCFITLCSCTSYLSLHLLLFLSNAEHYLSELFITTLSRHMTCAWYKIICRFQHISLRQWFYFYYSTCQVLDLLIYCQCILFWLARGLHWLVLRYLWSVLWRSVPVNRIIPHFHVLYIAYMFQLSALSALQYCNCLGKEVILCRNMDLVFITLSVDKTRLLKGSHCKIWRYEQLWTFLPLLSTVFPDWLYSCSLFYVFVLYVCILTIEILYICEFCNVKYADIIFWV